MCNSLQCKLIYEYHKVMNVYGCWFCLYFALLKNNTIIDPVNFNAASFRVIVFLNLTRNVFLPVISNSFEKKKSTVNCIHFELIPVRNSAAQYL